MGDNRLVKTLEQYMPVVLALLLIYALVRSLFAATAKVYWYDELLTQLVVAQGSLKGIMTALRGPVDGQPPLFYLIECLASRTVRNQEIALRLPSALGAVCALFFVFVYARRRGGTTAALLSAVFLLMTSVFQPYAQEARPYGMVIACVALALVCYQRAPAPLWMLLMGVALALAQSLHYLALLALIPFGLAELAELSSNKRFRWAVWAALGAGAAPLGIFWKLLMLNKAYYGAHHFFASFPFSAIPQMYGQLIRADSQVAMAGATTVLVAVVATTRWAKAGEGNVPETVLLCGFVGLPFFAFAFTKATHSVMTSRYILATVIGLALGIGYSLARAPRWVTGLLAVFVLTAVGVNELHFWRFLRADRREVAEMGSVAGKFITGSGYPALPVVVPNGSTLLWAVRYALPLAPQRFVYLTQDSRDDPSEDTTDRGLTVAQPYLGIRVMQTTEFTKANKQFLVYTEGIDVGKDRVTSRMLGEGWVVRSVSFDGYRALYLITDVATHP